MRQFTRGLLAAGFIIALSAAAQAQVAQYNATVTNASGQSVTGPQPVDASHGLPVNVVAGGAGGGAVYGPTAAGSAAANPPVLTGGTQDGTATGTVSNLKVDASHQAAVAEADGSNATLGAKADSVCGTATGTCSLEALVKFLNNAAVSAIVAGTNRIGYVSDDPCAQLTKSGAPINLTASGQVITGTSAKKTYICSIDLVSATAQNIALVEGTGSTCATNIFGLAGGTTAATGWNLAANGGLSKGGGVGTVYSPSADSNGTAANVCLLLSSTGQTSGQITYVQQ